jgi:hypothetical protein
LVLLDEPGEAEALLAKPFHPEDDRRFVEEARQRRQQVLDLLRAEGVQSTTAALRSWRDGTARALGVS